MTSLLDINKFEAFPKIVRYVNENVTITEKIDGTNAAFRVLDGKIILVQSRKRIISPGKDTDNAGFAGWVMKNEEAIAAEFGDGLHFGEWWGAGIHRGYGLDCKRFSPFNTKMWPDGRSAVIGDVPVSGVPVLYSSILGNLKDTLDYIHAGLLHDGSQAAPGYMNPEGCMVYFHGLGKYLKAPLDPSPKGEE